MSWATWTLVTLATAALAFAEGWAVASAAWRFKHRQRRS